MPKVQSRPTPAGRRSKDDVIDAALALLDTVGLPGLTMRRLAHNLGVQPSALYWHVADKQSLLAALSDRILTTPAIPPAPPSPKGWEDHLRAAAHDLRSSLLAHRDGAELVSSSVALGLITLPLRERIAAPLASAGASQRTTSVVAETLGHFVLGHTFDYQQRAQATEAGVLAAPTPLATSFGDGVDLVVAGTAVLLYMDAGD